MFHVEHGLTAVEPGSGRARNGAGHCLDRARNGAGHCLDRARNGAGRAPRL